MTPIDRWFNAGGKGEPDYPVEGPVPTSVQNVWNAAHEDEPEDDPRLASLYYINPNAREDAYNQGVRDAARALLDAAPREPTDWRE